MRKIKEILRLKAEAGLSDRAIAEVISASRSTVQECLRRARAAGLAWPLPAGVDDEALAAQLYRRLPITRSGPALPDFEQVHRELARKGVTRELLWHEFKAAHPEGVQYTAFCNGYRQWLATREPVFRQVHVPGDKLFVDYAGQTVPLVDRHTGQITQAQIFVAVLGASNYTFAEATLTQTLPDWLGSHVRALGYFGGVPRAIVPDNLKSAVIKALRYEPDLNPAYQQFAQHYAVAILPARVRRPKDKAKVEGAVLVVERWILARLRNRTFFSLGELNNGIAELLEDLNTRAFKKMSGSRRSLFEQTEQAALARLPARPYEYATWKKARVHLDYHIEVERGFYSVPYRLIGKPVEVRMTAHMLEVFHAGQLVAAHWRTRIAGRFHTLDAHRPPAHSAMVHRSLGRLLERAARIGTATREVIAQQAAHRKHPEETLRAALGILRLAQDYSDSALERACSRAVQLRVYSYRTVRTLISAPEPISTQAALDLAHENLRGASYFLH